MQDKVRAAMHGGQHRHRAFVHRLRIRQLRGGEVAGAAQRQSSRRANCPITIEPIAGSGVPKVGEPERSDIDDRKLP